MDAYDLTQNKQPFYIVGIGASAGGLEAIEKFFQNMPIDSGIAFVVVQHLSPDFKSLMNELLARHTEMVIRRAEDGMDVLPNHIYLIPPRKDLTVVDSQLHLDDQRMDGRLQSPINTFLQSLAEDRGAYAISVILSGTGSDGSIGIRAIAEQGGMVLVQDPATAGFDGMPRSAIATGKADLICAPEEMPAKILRHIQHPGYLQLDEEQAGDIITEENEISLIFAILRKKYALDFTKYKSSTILRRIERRMMLMRIQDVAEYVLRLQNDAAEVDKLYRDLLVEVTQFLRDKKAFEILREQIIPDIVKKADPKEGIRVWVPGCATGEEAYSLAMLFHEHLQKLETPVEVKIFATDVHNQSLEIASVGLYDEKSIQGLSPTI
jgi:two-component system CheB/CheR fusion protein